MLQKDPTRKRGNIPRTLRVQEKKDVTGQKEFFGGGGRKTAPAWTPKLHEGRQPLLPVTASDEKRKTGTTPNVRKGKVFTL